MTNSLQQALVPLAGAAGYKLHYSCNMAETERYYYVYEEYPDKPLKRVNIPGANGSLEGEVKVVLGWLAKAGYEVLVSEYPTLSRNTVRIWRKGNDLAALIECTGSTLHEALAEAVKALPREDAK